MDIGTKVRVSVDNPIYGWGGTCKGEIGVVVHKEVISYKKWFRHYEELFWVGVDFPSRDNLLSLAVSPNELEARE